MKQEIVLDKSYLQGASAGSIHSLCATFRVIMPGALFFELLTGDPVERARCFAKFPQVMNPVEIVEHVGRLLRFEASKKKPAPPLYERRHRMLFNFNTKLTDSTFVPTPEQQKGIGSWEKEVEREVDSFRERVALSHRWFPSIESASNRDRPGVIKEIQALVARDPKLVRKLYSSIRTKFFPRSAQLDSRWAFFRWMQVHVIGALDHVSRYGVGSDLTGARNLENEVVDLQYRIMGVLAGAIATRDKKCQEVFQMLRPDGLLVC
ncbi:MAG TPA: hypothetical protein VF789_16180 [Thermoanaerobaculia bacterium]